MAELQLRGKRQIKEAMLSKIIALLGINDVNVGSVLDVLTDAAAQEDFSQYVTMLQISRLVNLDAITGTDLDNKAFEYGLSRQAAEKATGLIDILRPSTFTKVSTTFYAGSPAPITGNTTIDVNDASDALIGTSGTLIIGRGTANEEEVTYSVGPVDNTNYWRFTLDAGLANDHAIEETVILKQGSDESILAGTIVVVPATGASSEIQFTIDEDTTLLAGEDKVQNVAVTAVEAGADGNIPIKAIEGEAAFSSPPFTGARAENTSKFTTGKNRETDNELRDSIRDHIQSLSRGVKEAILNAIVGLVDADTAKRVVSANVILPQDTNTPVKVYIDDGLGFEPSFSQQGFEEIISSATGGESRLQLDIFPLVKAQLETTLAEPYDFSGASRTLTYEVGSVSETITIDSTDFTFPEVATAEDLVTVINNKSSLIEARTSQVGTQIVIMAKADTNEDIIVTGGTANTVLSFPTTKKETLYLYINDVKQSKDGITATIDSVNSGPYDLLNVGAYPHTLTVVVDGKTANTQTATINTVDVAVTSAVTAAEIIAVLNRDLAGVTASLIENGAKVRLTSNTETSASSKVRVTGGTANNATDGLNFSTIEVSGADKDYTLNRELGTVELETALVANDLVTVGSKFTRAKLRASIAENYAPNNTETLVISVDGGADQTITFDTTFSGGKTAADTATFINASLNGATASVRTIGGLNYLEITTNTYDEAVGSIEIQGTSTGNTPFGFTLDSQADSIEPHKSYQVSAAGPFNFAETDSLVVVIDNNITDNTFQVVMDYDSSATGGTSTTVFTDSTLPLIFPNDDELNNFYVAFKSGANTDATGTISDVALQSGTTYRYTYSVDPTNFANFAVNDLVEFTGLVDAENNGNFLITGKGASYIEVTNANGVNATGQTGSSLLSERNQISDYNGTSGQITVGAAFTNTPSASDTFIVLPSTIDNLIDYMNNTKITSLSLKAVIEGVTNNTKLQISSKSEGSDGYVQITGGGANDAMAFSTTQIQGLQAYNYYTGLLKLVHQTIYGDDADLISFPGVGAAGVQFQVLAPTVREISVAVDVTLEEGVSISSLENEIKSAISAYINNRGVGDDIIFEEITCAVLGISGITDVVVNDPTANIAIADNEVGRVKDSNMTIS